MKGKGNSKLSGGFKLAWATRSGSMAVLMVLLNTYVSFFATNFMGISVATVGVIFMIAKVFDGITDLFAGYLIDHTHTRLGKGRPYELALIGYWGCTVLLYCAPEMGVNAAAVFLFIVYSLINSVFYTLLSCNEPVYLANAVSDSSQVVSLSSFTGIVTMLFTLVATIVLPQLVKTLGTTREGWRLISIVLAIPFTVLGLIRFARIKEIKTSEQVKSEKLSVRDEVRLLFKNKYILIFAAAMLIANIGSNMGTGVDTYYYMYIMGDVGLASYGAVSVIGLILSIALTPALSKKFGFMKVIRAIVLIGMAGFLLRLFNVHSIPLMVITCFLRSTGITTVYMFINVFVMDCMDYGEWKNGKRNEGVISCANGLMCKVGTAFGLGICGVFLGWSGFDAALKVQTASANTMLIALETVVPAACCLILYILLRVYNLDRMMPQIKKDLEERHNVKTI